MKAFTDIEQSKKLAEILSLESADMYIDTTVTPSFTGLIREDVPKPVTINDLADNKGIYPCWSLAALLSIIPEVSLNTFKDGKWNAMIQHNGKMIYGDKDNPVDACYEMILKSHELKML